MLILWIGVLLALGYWVKNKETKPKEADNAKWAAIALIAVQIMFWIM